MTDEQLELRFRGLREMLSQLLEAARSRPEQRRGRDFLIREQQVCDRLCIGRATLAQLVREKQFPAPVRTRPNKAWRSSQCDRYIAVMTESVWKDR